MSSFDWSAYFGDTHQFMLPHIKETYSTHSASVNPNFRFKMKSIFVILSILLAIDWAMAAQKLQIGIKKRVENCEMKAQKGDLVHIHYTVQQMDESTTCL